MRPNPKNLKKVDNTVKMLTAMDNEVKSSKRDLTDAYDVSQVCVALNQGYNQIHDNKEFVMFQNKEDEIKYTAVNPMTTTKRMLSVFDVWMDLFKGKYSDKGMIFWIIISSLVDIAAFIFFALAFRKND